MAKSAPVAYSALLQQARDTFASGGSDALIRLLLDDPQFMDPGLLEYLGQVKADLQVQAAFFAVISAHAIRMREQAVKGPSETEPSLIPVVRRYIVDLLTSAPDADTATNLMGQVPMWVDNNLISTAREMASVANDAGLTARAHRLSAWSEAVESYLHARAAIPQKLREAADAGVADVDPDYWRDGMILEAEQYLGRQTSHDDPGDPVLAECLVEIARLYASDQTIAACLFRLGCMRLLRHEGVQATAAFEESLRLDPQAPNDVRLRILGNIASAQAEAGDPAKARDTYLQVIAAAADDDSTGAPRANALLNLAALERDMGHFKTSAMRYQEVLESQHAATDCTGAAHLGLANLHTVDGHTSLALAHAAEVLTLEQSDPPSRRFLQARTVVGHCLSRLGLHDEAAKLLRTIHDEVSRRGDSYNAARIAGDLAAEALAQKDLEVAKQLAGEALAEHVRRADQTGEMTAHIILAEVVHRQQDSQAAEEHLASAYAKAEKVEAAPRLLASVMAGLRLSDTQAVSEGALEWSRRGIEMIRRLRRRTRSTDARAAYFDTAHSLLLGHAELCSRAASPVPEEAAATMDEAHSWMHVDEFEGGDAGDIGESDLEATQSRLDASSAVLVMGGRGHAQHGFLITRSHVRGPFGLELREALRVLLDLHRNAETIAQPGASVSVIADAVIAAGDAIRELGRTVRNWEIWKALHDQAPHRLAIAASPTLLSLPFHALEVFGDGHDLLEAVPGGVTYAPAASVFARCCSGIRRELTQLRQSRWIVLTDPERSVPGRRLPASVEEAQAFGSRATLFQGDEATQAAFWQAMRDAQLFAFIGHGVSDTYDAMETGLRLASTQSQAPSQVTARDLIQPGEAAQRAPSVCYLNACHAGATSLRPDRPLSGFVRALLYRGCRAIIAPTWPIMDDVAPDFTSAMLKAWHSGGDIATAVREGILAVREAHPQPFHWAGYRLFGGT